MMNLNNWWVEHDILIGLVSSLKKPDFKGEINGFNQVNLQKGKAYLRRIMDAVRFFDEVLAKKYEPFLDVQEDELILTETKTPKFQSRGKPGPLKYLYFCRF